MASEDKNQELNVNLEKKPICGIVMPISSIDNCSESHWVDVKGIIIFAALIAIASLAKLLTGKKASPILMILISAALGMVMYS